METKRFLSTRDIVLCALGAVLIAVCSFISIPTIVPFTLQTFAVFTVLSVLGGKRGLISIAVYIALGAAGAPVFAGFKSGAAVLLGPTGGYIVGFLLTGAVYLAFVHFLGEKIWVKALSLGIGLAICYAFGTAWFMFVKAGAGDPRSLGASLLMCVVPFIIPDAVKLALALIISRRLAPRLK